MAPGEGILGLVATMEGERKGEGERGSVTTIKAVVAHVVTTVDVLEEEEHVEDEEEYSEVPSALLDL